MFAGIGIAISLFIFLLTDWSATVKVTAILISWVVLFFFKRTISKVSLPWKRGEGELEEEDEEGEEEEGPKGVGGGRLRRIAILIVIVAIILTVVTAVLPKLSNLTGGLPTIQKVSEEQAVVGEFSVVIPTAVTEKFADDGTKLGIITAVEAERAAAIDGFEVTQVKVNGQVHKVLASLLDAIRAELEAGHELDVFVFVTVTCAELKPPECWEGPAWTRPNQSWIEWLQEKVTTAGGTTSAEVASEEGEVKAEGGESNVFFACLPFILVFALYFFIKYRVDKLGQPRTINPREMNLVFSGGEQPGLVDWSLDYELSTRRESLWDSVVAIWNIFTVQEARTRQRLQTRVNALLTSKTTKMQFGTFEKKRGQIEGEMLEDPTLAEIARRGGIKIITFNIERAALTKEAASAEQQRQAARRGARSLTEFEKLTKRKVTMWEWIGLQVVEAIQAFLGSRGGAEQGGEQ